MMPYNPGSASAPGSSSHTKRRKKRPIHGTKTVSVTRGRSGYGFTISGQHPCVLSCIVGGSKAEEAGLKAGDYLVSVNNENVTKAPHDDVVRMVGMSTGTLTLQVAENYNSSDSSDDEYHHRTKARYPNRVRTRAPGAGGGRHGDKVLGECNQRDKHNSGNDHKHNKDSHLHRYENSNFKFTSATKPRLHTPVGAENTYATPTNHSTPLLAGPLSVNKQSTVASVHATPAFNFQAKQAIVKSTVHSAPPREPRQRPVGSRHNYHSRQPKDHAHFNTSLAGASISAIMKTSVTNTTANNAFIAMEDEDEDGDDEESLLNADTENVKVVVGYIGSIEMPSDANKPHIKIQSIRNAVRRLRVEQKIHTLVLMEVTEDGVKLTNSMGTTVAHYPADRLTFSGISPDDKRFFGIVTLHSTNSDDASSDNGSQEESTPSGSCHVFMVDPEMRSHNMHAAKAKSFGIACSSGGERQSCIEFPKSATPVIMAITNLYKNRPGVVLDNEVALSQAFADPSRAVQRSHSNSSNSDSGLGFGRDEAPNNEHAFVVDMPPPAGPPPTPQQPIHNGMHAHINHCSPDNQTMPTPVRDTHKMFTHPDIRARLNVSVCSTDDLHFMKTNSSDKLNIRAMPDRTLTPGARTHSSDGLDMQNSAASLRANSQKILKAQRTPMTSQGVSSDQESSTSQGSEMYRSASNPDLHRPSETNRPISAPSKQFWDDSFSRESQTKAETVDLDGKKLSPRAFLPPPFHQLRSPSAPPTFDNSFDNGAANTSGMGGLIEQFEQNSALRISSPAETFGKYHMETKRKMREKERTTVDDTGERWAKPHNIRHRKMSRLQQPLSHSHESLVAIEQEVATQRLSTASSANNINDHLDEDEKEEEEIGRIAGWAVGFEKMLGDVGGLAVFTEFLKKEFSEENIIFWRICEQYKSVSDNDKRKTKAKDIFAKHISVKASDPVNIDHVARQQVEKQLDHPNIHTFDKPQQEIFKLMKQDSYPRFLKSELYKTYLMREMGGEPLGLPKDDFQGILGAKELKEEKKKAAKSKDTEDKEKRRRSLLPWRQKSSKNNLKSTSDSDLKKNSNKATTSTSTTTKESEVNNNTTNTQKKVAPGPGIDLSTIRKEVQASTKESKEAKEADDSVKFCRVILPDGSTTVVCAKPGQNIRSVLGKLCDKRSLSIAAVDVFLLGSDKPLDLSEDISTLGSREVMIERRVLFRMDLPNRKSIGVKAKPNRSIRDVFKPILNKYGFKLDNICVQLSGQPGMVDIDAQVSSIDNQRVLIKHLDEVMDPESSPQVPRKGSGDHRSLGLFGLLRKESQAAKVAEIPKVKSKHKVTFNLQKNQTRKAETQEDDRFLDLLSKVQSGRLDDQRGLDTQNSEIPEFLQNKSYHPSGRESAPPILSGRRSRADDYVKSNHEKYVSYTRGQMMTRPSSVSLDSMTFERRSSTDKDQYDNDVFDPESPANAIQHGNQSFSADGVIPSNTEAQDFFQASVPDCPDFDDPRMAEKSLRDIGFDYSFNMYQAKAWGYSRHSPYAQQKLSSPGNAMSTEEDETFLDETLTPNDPDFDNTLISSPVQGHLRSLSVPVSLHTPANKGSKSRENGLVQTSTPLPKSDTVQMNTPLSQKSEIKSGVSDVTPNKTYNTSVSQSSAFRQPTSQIMSSPSDNKPMIIDLGESETNITFV